MNALNPDGGDTHEMFKHDTMQSGGGYSDEALVQQLVVSVHVFSLSSCAY
jgi:aspartate oxidase